MNVRCPKKLGQQPESFRPGRVATHHSRVSLRVAHVPRAIRAERGRVLRSTRALAEPLVRVRSHGGGLEISNTNGDDDEAEGGLRGR